MPSGESARVLAVASGKGGVGKTNVAVNLAIALADAGQRVTLLDMDLGLANADILLNVRASRDLGEILEGTADIDDVTVLTKYGIRLVPGASGDTHLANLGERERSLLGDALEYLTTAADFVIVDTGAGISRNTTAFASAADEVILVATPEPTSIMDAYAMVKTLAQLSRDVPIHLVLNMARDELDARRAIKHIQNIARNFIDIQLVENAYLLYTQEVGNAVRKRQPFIRAYPDSQPSRAIRGLVQELIRNPLSRHQHEQGGFFSRWMRSLARRA